MTLSRLIRKRDSMDIATAAPATFATHGQVDELCVARVATVAVAKSAVRKGSPVTSSALSEVMRWLVSIEETDQKLIDEVIARCREEPGALTYFLWRAAGEDK